MAIHNHQDGQHYYVVQDLLRSVRGLVRRDGGQGTWVGAWRYRLYGEVLTSDGSLGFTLRFRWAGAQLDEETGLYYLRSRYYSPAFGRFIQEDPIGFAGGANLYAYGADPTSGRDPDGLSMKYEPPPENRWNDDCWSDDCSGAWSRGEGFAGFSAWALLTQWEQNASYSWYSQSAQRGIDQANPFLQHDYPGLRLSPFSPSEFGRAWDALANFVEDPLGIPLREFFLAALQDGGFVKEVADGRTYHLTQALGGSGELRVAATPWLGTAFSIVNQSVVARGVDPRLLAHILAHEGLHMLGLSHRDEIGANSFNCAVYLIVPASANLGGPVHLGACGR